MKSSPRLMYLVLLVLASRLMVNDAAVRVWGLWASGLSSDSQGYRPDPYVKVWCAGTSGGMTETVNDTFNPSWRKEFNFSSCKPGATLKLEVWDKDLFNDDLLGSCNYKLSSGSFTSVKCTPKKGSLFFNYTAK